MLSLQALLLLLVGLTAASLHQVKYTALNQPIPTWQGARQETVPPQQVQYFRAWANGKTVVTSISGGQKDTVVATHNDTVGGVLVTRQKDDAANRGSSALLQRLRRSPQSGGDGGKEPSFMDIVKQFFKNVVNWVHKKLGGPGAGSSSASARPVSTSSPSDVEEMTP